MAGLESDYAIPTFASYTSGAVDPAVTAYMEILEEYIRTLHNDIRKLSVEITELKQRVTTLENP